MRYSALFIFALSFFSAAASAAYGRGGSYSMGVQLGTVSATQSQLNELIKRANTREGGITTGELNSAYELSAQVMYRFKGTVYAALFRPSFLYQQQNGSGSGGAFKYGIMGFTVMPILRLYPLENEFMKFFMQFGLGYGRVMGSIEENSASAPGHGSVDFAGGTFGSQAGLGAEFCFSRNHCATFEGNYRVMAFERLLASNVSGSFPSGSLSQAANGQEVEVDSQDLAVGMGGLMFMLGYTYWF